MIKMSVQKNEPKSLTDWELEEHIYNKHHVLHEKYVLGKTTLDQIRRKLRIKRRAF